MDSVFSICGLLLYASKVLRHYKSFAIPKMARDVANAGRISVSASVMLRVP